jgi:hypothetical protein
VVMALIANVSWKFLIRTVVRLMETM